MAKENVQAGIHEFPGEETHYLSQIQHQLAETAKWKEKFEKETRALRGDDRYGYFDVTQFGFPTELIFPKDFKMPDFVKFNGFSNPIHHLQTYCTKMMIWSKDETFLLGLFHESLIGPALQWFLDLEAEKKQDWKDFTRLFVNQYGFNLDATPTREDLSNMKKMAQESFKQYAQRWMNQAVQVKPPLTMVEMCNYFVSTLETPYVGAMAGGAYNTFSVVIDAGERIESLIKAGKLVVPPPSEGSSSKKNFTRKSDSAVQNVQVNPPTAPPTISFPNSSSYSIPQALHPQTLYPQSPYYPPYPYSHVDPRSHPIHNIYNPSPPSNIHPSNTNPTQPQQNQNTPSHQKRNWDNRPFPNVGIPKLDLLNVLVSKNLLTQKALPALKPPYPIWYDPSLTCAFHLGTIGHSIETCGTFRRAVLSLIDKNKIALESSNAPNVQNNPLPSHNAEKSINRIDINEGVTFGDIGSFSPTWVLSKIREAGYLMVSPRSCAESLEREPDCLFCWTKDDHITEECDELKRKIDEMMNLGVVSVFRRMQAEIGTIGDLRQVPFRIPASPSPSEPVVKIILPAPFPYESNNAIPWRYDSQILVQNVAPTATNSLQSQELRPVIIIKDGKILTQGSQESEEVPKEKDVGGITRAGRCYTSEQLEKERQEKLKRSVDKPESCHKNGGNDQEDEFLQIVKQSEYSIAEQLKKTPAKISLHALIMSSEVHRKALQEILDKAFVYPDITTENMTNLVNSIKLGNCISFTEDEIAPSSTGYPRALHITVKCEGNNVAKVLIDGGSALNVLPFNTLKRLPIDLNKIQSTSIMVKSFDGTASQTMGRITLPLQIGPAVFNVELEVMDISPSYTILLGRPWIHGAKAVPSTLHQRVKFTWNNNLVSVHGEEDIILAKASSIPYIDGTEEPLSDSHVGFEVVEDHSVGAQIMAKNGYQIGQGLGAQTQGITEPIQLPPNINRQGLGYDGALIQKVKNMKLGSSAVPHIRETFPAPAEIVAITDNIEIYALENQIQESGVELDNWEMFPIIDLTM